MNLRFNSIIFLDVSFIIQRILPQIINNQQVHVPLRLHPIVYPQILNKRIHLATTKTLQKQTI